ALSWAGPAVDDTSILRDARLTPYESRNFMSEMSRAASGSLDPVQAVELALLVDLEARWENLRKPSLRAPAVEPVTQDLQAMQKAYEAFRSKLAAYNKRYTPAHVPELLLNTPTRLGAWCRTMRDLFS